MHLLTTVKVLYITFFLIKYNLIFFAAKKIIDEFKYLSVDYDDYAVVYNCRNIDENKSVQNVWVVSRTPNLSDNGKSKVHAILDEHFDRSKIKSVKQNPDICDEQNVTK